ncbi:MAG: alcohol dehydrogenase catalytic domain-containing protein [Chloroflexi bacterium]|nr:alcohol dehydrogenase catalytic domain-containing protein [Chloroflexota bacterium]
MRAAGIGNWDELVRIGGWDVGIRPPMALGVEAAGTVRDVGSRVTRFAPGDAVLVHAAPLRDQGAWAELFLANAADVAAKPADLEWRVAGALPVPLLTAIQVVAGFRGGRDETVLVHGAAGVTGGLIVAMASATGARVVATCSPRAARRVRGYGASETFDYRNPAWRDQARLRAPGGFGSVANAARGEAAGLIALVADGGRLATITGDPPRSERGVAVTDVYVAPDGVDLEAAAADLVARGLSIAVAGTCGLGGAAAALERVARGGGAYVVLPTG